jgi:hypothetical protein
MFNKHGGKNVAMKQIRCNNINYEIARCFDKHGDEDDFIVGYDIILLCYMHNTNAQVLKQMKINKLHGFMSSFMPKQLLSSSFFC